MEHSESNSCSSIENRWTEVFMWLIARKAAVFFAISPLLALVAPPASASPLFPGVSASKSVNGRFLVVVRLHFQDPNATSGAVTGATFEVMQVESSISENYGLHSSSIFYSNASYISW
jgi:hypothetical protein